MIKLYSNSLTLIKNIVQKTELLQIKYKNQTNY